MKKFLIVKCIPLNDQYECDADRKPLCVIKAEDIPSKYKKYYYEVYEIFENGSITLRQNYDDYE